MVVSCLLLLALGGTAGELDRENRWSRSGGVAGSEDPEIITALVAEPPLSIGNP